MKISSNWLSEYVAHGLGPEHLADRLTMAGLEVDGLEIRGQDLSGVLVGHVRAVRPHPNADRLTLCDVDVGEAETVQIICGAPNVAEGQKVPVAPVGSTLSVPDRSEPSKRVPLTIKKAKIRGERSYGMICAEDELGLSDDHSGIMVLDGSAEVGGRLIDYLSAKGRSHMDAILDVAITPNRQDAISHIGVARDVAALTGRSLRLPDVEVPESGGRTAEIATVRIESPEGCGRYVALVVEGVRIADSPSWLKQRLESVGLRPRNNVVDVTNYVMYECGQPLHAFDFHQLAGHAIVVRKTDKETKFVTLDDKERSLPTGTLMICDAEGPVAVAGVMGGENSEVSESTTTVLIESAHFDPSTIRRAAKSLGLQTDASYRFERGVDPQGTARAAARAAQLIVELAGGTLVGGMIDACPRPFELREVRLRASRIEKVLGVSIGTEEVGRLLKSIGFDLAYNSASRTWMCTVPSFRTDIEREIDVIEEVARLYGYDRIPEPDSAPMRYGVPRFDRSELWRERVRRTFSGMGFREAYTNSLLPDHLARRYARGGAESAVGTLNAVSQEMTTLRPSLLPGLLRVVAHNLNHGQRAIRLLEFGHVFVRSPHGGGIVPGFEEHENLLLVASGDAIAEAWDQSPRQIDIFDLKGAVERLGEILETGPLVMKPASSHPVADLFLEIHIGDRLVGGVGRITAAAAPEFDLKESVYFAELTWDELAPDSLERDMPSQYRPVSRFPLVERDLAVVVDRSVPAGDIMSLIAERGGGLLRSVSLFDIYEGDQIDPGKKSLAFRIVFGADRTLIDPEVDQEVSTIMAALSDRHGAALR